MIRAVTPGDLWLLRRKPRSVVLFYDERMLVRLHRAWLFGLRCAIEGTGRDGATYIATESGLRAVVQARGRRERPEFDLLYLAAYGPDGRTMPTDHELWFRLLQRLCEGAAQHRIQRIYAPLAQRDDDLRELFRQLGFHSYAQQTALRLEGPDWDQGTTLAPMRSQSRRDEWGIHKLYGAVTPRMVQQAEARNPRTWALPLSQRMGGTQRRGWVLGPEDDLTAYLRVMHGSVGHVFSLLIRPEARDLMPDVLRFGLAQILDTRPVYLLLREYQSELLAAAHHLGFHPIGDQALLVKSMVIPFQRTVLMPALEPGLEPNVRISNTG